MSPTAEGSGRSNPSSRNRLSACKALPTTGMPERMTKIFRLMSPEQQQVLFENTARAQDDAPMVVKIRHIGNCLKADKAYSKGVADA
jgi:catalase